MSVQNMVQMLAAEFLSGKDFGCSAGFRAQAVLHVPCVPFPIDTMS